MSVKLKKLLNEFLLGELPSSKLFKYNEETGKFESPASRTSTNEAIKPGLERAYVDAEDAFEELQGRLEVVIGQINSKKPKTQDDVIMQAKVQNILKQLTKLEKDFLNIEWPVEEQLTKTTTNEDIYNEDQIDSYHDLLNDIDDQLNNASEEILSDVGRESKMFKPIKSQFFKIFKEMDNLHTLLDKI